MLLVITDQLGQHVTRYRCQYDPRSCVSSSAMQQGLLQLLTISSRKYYFSIVKNAKDFERSDKYPELPGDPSWQSITADDAEVPIIIVEGRNDIID